MYARVRLTTDALDLLRVYGSFVRRLPSLDRLRTIDPRTFDALLAIALTVIGVGSMFGGSDPDNEYRDPDAIAVVLGLVASVPLYWRRRAPLPALMVGTVGLCAASIAQYQTNSLAIPILFLVYAVGAYAPRRDALVGLALVEIAIVVVFLSSTPDLDAGGMVFNLALFAGFWLAGQVMSARADEAEARFAEAEERAEAQRQHAARAVAEERLHLAQELHDVVAHSMSVIAVQAGMGVHVIDTQPDEARQALEAISRTSRSTLQEMRRLLGVLRGEDGAPAHFPAPSIADLSPLVADIRAAGLDVELVVDGDPEAVPQGVQMSVFRIVQEGLTNVIKHAGSASATATVSCSETVVEVSIVDDGRGAAARDSSTNGHPDTGGHGLVGMRERVDLWSGTLDAGPRPDGGYRVHASLSFGSPA